MTELDKSWNHRTQFDWPAKFPISVQGERQSPIDIKIQEAKKKKGGPLKLDLIEGSKDSEWTFVNNGHTFVASPPEGVSWELSGGAIEGVFQLSSFHAHWGTCKGHGSDHLLSGKRFDGEMHFVFKAKAGQKKMPEDGFVALGILLNEQPATDEKAKPVIEDTLGTNLTKITAPAVEPVMIPAVDMHAIFPIGKGEYYAYKGSLTTPPFTESVMHVLYEKPLDISAEFMGKLRDLDGIDGEKMTFNYRNIQPTFNRKIFKAK
ncbi:carbonic anhydrase 2-like [Symsagittifera roscoffensis]|uniref:carbonic anhydrase 2-like n=1 Tax=Symsagittifera roscoffensis TaxID=84072 RepID=UPI00307C0C78